MTPGFGGSSSSSLYTGSHHTSPMGASPGLSLSQQRLISTSMWGSTGPSQYQGPQPLPSNAVASYSAQGISRSRFHCGDKLTNSYSEMQSLPSGVPAPPSNALPWPIGQQSAIDSTQGMLPTSQIYPYVPTVDPLQPMASA